MEFEAAIKCLKEGERIKRSHWKAAYLKIENKRVKMCMGFRKPWYYTFRNDDIFATDWVIDTNHMFVDEAEQYNGMKPLTGKLNFN
jgi:hypothetical protein